MDNALIQFLRDELSISDAALDLAKRQQDVTTEQLPIILWQYGLVTIEELDRIFDWMAAA